jgi:plastocyanin
MAQRKIAPLLIVALLSTALLLLVSGCSSPSSSGTGGATTGGATGGAAGGVTVVEKNFQFTPSSVNIKVGDTVTFENQDSTAHDVVIGTTDLGPQQPGALVSWTAEADGTFPFACSIHPSMTGQIVVGAGGTSGGAAPPTSGGTNPPASGGSGSGTGY